MKKTVLREYLKNRETNKVETPKEKPKKAKKGDK